ADCPGQEPGARGCFPRNQRPPPPGSRRRRALLPRALRRARSSLFLLLAELEVREGLVDSKSLVPVDGGCHPGIERRAGPPSEVCVRLRGIEQDRAGIVGVSWPDPGLWGP